MPQVRYAGCAYELHEGETVLDGLLRHGVSLSHACRAGVCQGCLVRVTDGVVPEAGQRGLKPAWRAQGYLLSCQAVAQGDLGLAPLSESATTEARIIDLTWLSDEVVRVVVEAAEQIEGGPGQFIQLVRDDGLARPYSLAWRDGCQLELHVAVRPHAGMSRWLAREARPGTKVQLKGPFGDCFYLPGRPQEKLVLAGTGTGLSPLLGVVRTALGLGHHGPIWLYHASRRSAGLYLWRDLLKLADEHSNLTVTGCVGENELGLPQVSSERLEQRVARDHPQLAGARVFLCGNPALVKNLKRSCYLAGASLDAILSDPFLPALP